MKWMMLVEDILGLQSYDSRLAKTQFGTVEEILEEKYIDDKYHQDICVEMRKAGVNLVPVLIVNDTLQNGHHRVKIARLLGHEEMLVTDNRNESGWLDDEYSSVVTFERKGT